MKKTLIYSAIGIAGLLLLALLIVGGKAFNVTDRVTDSDNIVESQKAFEEMYQAAQVQEGKCGDYFNILIDDPTPGNRQIYTAAVSKLRAIVGDYNAKARSMENKHWRSGDTPANIAVEEAEDGSVTLSFNQ